MFTMQAGDGSEPNVVLIGMPWSGKSTAGVLLAKALARPFTDTDVLIQAGEGRTLQEIIDAEGANALQTLEERYVLSLECSGHVIATGGSVVYSEAAIGHLKVHGQCVYLRLPYSVVEARADNIDFRGLVRQPGQTLADLFALRAPLYERYADIVVDCEGLSHRQTVQALVDALPEFQHHTF